MSTPDQTAALRAHLDNALAGVGSRLPGDAAPALLQTARRRNRTQKIAATAGSAIVIAALVVGVGSQLTTNAGNKPSVIGPATAPPSAAASQASPQPSTSGEPATTAPAQQASAQPSIADHSGMNIVAQRAISADYLGQANDEIETFGDATYILGRGGNEDPSAPDTLVKVDLATGDTTTLATKLPGPVGHFTVVNGKVYVPEVINNLRLVAVYSATDGASLNATPIVATGDDAQIENTYLAAVGSGVLVATPGKGKQTNVLTIGPQEGTTSYGSPIAVADLQIVGSIGTTAYLTSPTQIFAYGGNKVLATAALPFNAVVTVSDEGLYVQSRNDTGGDDPTRAITLTLSRLDPTTLQTTVTKPETLTTGVITSPGVTAVVVNKILYTTIGTCQTAPTTDVCVQRRDPESLAILGTVARVSEGATDQSKLQQSTDGTAVLAIRNSDNTREQIDLLGDAPAG